ncbi:MAG: alanine--glyoxylate aminotransferase family protein [Planctomycetaceae bacterium]|nr:Serine-pyruvate aminotransferase [Planctomycetota bacterium]NUO15452.1 alanine--glyoxylate aminotransferase family protein [Planctomycetaceae bacterium]GIK52490.1 MAG: serine-pyruvate aminotransferase [Planctomycetota bacterium]HRJ78581.1 alanine--glyoxylate aminotransferase family protein [Planctomycetota bacterium]
MVIKPRVLTPGPTALLPEAALAQAAASMHHRTDAFIELFKQVREGLKHLFQTRRDVLMFSASGTGGLEACVVNLVRPGDEVICVNAGKFGERWTKMNRTFGAKVHELKLADGQAVSVSAVKQALDQAPQCRAVFVQGSESSTATVHPVREIAALVRERPQCVICVDAITWIGAHEVRTDDWGLDLVVCGSQKALAMPPGLAFVSISEKAEKLMQGVSTPRYYFDFAREAKAQKEFQTAFTPAISLVAALAASLAWVRQLGVENLWRNASVLASMTREAMKAIGLEIFSQAPSDSVTAVCAPAALGSGKIIKRMKERHGAIIADGQDDLKNRVFRLAHLGYYDYMEALGLIGALEDVLLGLGHSFESGKALAAAQAQYRKLTATH